MATYSSNSTIKMVGSVSSQNGTTNGVTSLYDVPAGHYAIVTLNFYTSGSPGATLPTAGWFLIGGRVIFAGSGIYIGPGQNVSTQAVSSGLTGVIQGVLFTNTP